MLLEPIRLHPANSQKVPLASFHDVAPRRERGMAGVEGVFSPGYVPGCPNPAFVVALKGPPTQVQSSVVRSYLHRSFIVLPRSLPAPPLLYSPPNSHRLPSLPVHVAACQREGGRVVAVGTPTWALASPRSRSTRHCRRTPGRRRLLLITDRARIVKRFFS